MVAIESASAESFGAALNGQRDRLARFCARLDIITARDTLEVLYASESA